MNTTKKGDDFEEVIYQLFLKEIKDNKTIINPNAHIKAFRKKKYYSRYREKDIEFDIAIEVYQDEPPRLYRRVIYLSQAAMPDRVKLS